MPSRPSATTGPDPVRGGVPRGTSPAVVAALAVAATSALSSALVWGEVVHARAARRATALPSPPPGSTVAVVVLGFGNRGARINSINRWRARIAVRTAQRAASRGAAVTIICSGGSVHGATPEADLLGGYIARELHWHGSVLVERTSVSTWENVRNVLPLIGGAQCVVFASNGLHAEKARNYLRRQRPDLAGLLAPADDYRPGEMIAVKPIFAAVGLWKLRAMFHVEQPRRC
nr:YdcF family protein [Curtobacterium pusillum]